MKRTRAISRTIFFLVSVIMLIYINKKSKENTESILEFKFKMFQKMQTDSLDSKQKLELLADETTKFVDDSSRVKEGIQYLSALLVLLAIVEFLFLVLIKREYQSRQ